jgi:3-methyladenine DNA glycosylase AlkD
MSKDILGAIRQELKQQADAAIVSSSRRFFKEPVTLYGVKTASVTKIARDYFRQVKPLGKRGVFALAETMLQTDYCEEAYIAFNWAYQLRDEYEPGDFAIFEDWLNKYVNNWAKCDTLCNHAIGSLVTAYPQYTGNLVQWTGSENRWVRRGAAVTLIVPARQGKFLEDVFRIADRLLADEDDLVQKGYGWMLKASSEAHREEVYNYVLRNRQAMPRTALRYAIEKMPPEMRRAAMARP